MSPNAQMHVETRIVQELQCYLEVRLRKVPMQKVQLLLVLAGSEFVSFRPAQAWVAVEIVLVVACLE